MLHSARIWCLQCFTLLAVLHYSIVVGYNVEQVMVPGAPCGHVQIVLLRTLRLEQGAFLLSGGGA